MITDKIMANFQFIESHVIEFSIENNSIRTQEKIINVDIDMDYDIINCIEVEDRFLGVLHFIVNLSAKIEDNEAFKIHLTMEGKFKGFKETLLMSNFKEMLEVNGTATLSQISRAYITSVTSLSGMIPINLPMVNIYEMKKYKEITK